MSIKGKAVIECYENYREEDRLTTNQARKIEFITTVRVLQDIMPTSGKILDCAAGTGVYAFHFADKGYEVTATDITPRHIINIGIVEENLRLRKWYEENGAVHIGTKKFDFFPFTCGYMKKKI